MYGYALIHCTQGDRAAEAMSCIPEINRLRGLVIVCEC